MKNYAIIAAALAAAAAAAPASADTLYANPQLIAPTSSPNSGSFTANSSGGAGTLSFDIDGYATLDGTNFYEDDFTLTQNGSTILTLSYDLGGGGGSTVFTNPFGATVTRTPAGAGSSGKLSVNFASLLLAGGANQFTFSYASPSGDALGGAGGHAGPQGFGDEGFGISNVLLTGAVPEPATWGMMILGFGVVGAAMRRRSTKVVFA